MHDRDRDVCGAALDAVTEAMNSEALVNRVVDLMFEFSGELKTRAAKVLKRLNDVRGATRLLDILNDMDKEEFHWICIDALASLYAEQPATTD